MSQSIFRLGRGVKGRAAASAGDGGCCAGAAGGVQCSGRRRVKRGAAGGGAKGRPGNKAGVWSGGGEFLHHLFPVFVQRFRGGYKAKQEFDSIWNALFP